MADRRSSPLHVAPADFGRAFVLRDIEFDIVAAALAFEINDYTIASAAGIVRAIRTRVHRDNPMGDFSLNNDWRVLPSVEYANTLVVQQGSIASGTVKFCHAGSKGTCLDFGGRNPSFRHTDGPIPFSLLMVAGIRARRKGHTGRALRAGKIEGAAA